MGIDILGIDIIGVDILGIDIPAPTPTFHTRRLETKFETHDFHLLYSILTP